MEIFYLDDFITTTQSPYVNSILQKIFYPTFHFHIYNGVWTTTTDGTLMYWFYFVMNGWGFFNQDTILCSFTNT